MAKLVTVSIVQDGPNAGDFSVDLTGFHGKGCSDVQKIFDGLGTKTKDIEKPEFKDERCGVVTTGR